MGRTWAYFQGLSPKRFKVIPHGVDERFARGDPSVFRSQLGITENFVFSVGAFIRGKNRVNLIHAMNGTGIRLVVAGNVIEKENYEECRKLADDNITLIEGIPYESDLLPSAYAAADAFSLPSYYETFCLAAMEAAVANCSLVLGNRWEADEIYGNRARYVDPDDVAGIRSATLAAFETGKQDFSAHFLNDFRWDAIAQRLLEVYEMVIG